uniref:Uncharacterized protein n=1 Tax=Amphimedon queenslandica TaxID=400682 RepID=A0A1X7U2U2_AMPQE
MIEIHSNFLHNIHVSTCTCITKFFPSKHTIHWHMHSSVLTISLSDILSLLDKESNIVSGFDNPPVYTKGRARSSLGHETLRERERAVKKGER